MLTFLLVKLLKQWFENDFQDSWKFIEFRTHLCSSTVQFERMCARLYVGKKNGIPRVVHSHRLRWSMRHHSLFLCFLYLKCAFSNSVNEVNSPLEKNKYCFRYACAWCLMKPDVLLCQTFHLIDQELSTLQKLWCVIYLLVWHDSAASVAFVFTAGSQTLIRD